MLGRIKVKPIFPNISSIAFEQKFRSLDLFIKFGFSHNYEVRVSVVNQIFKFFSFAWCTVNVYIDIPELLNVYLIFENEEVSPVGVLKRGGLKRVANGDLRKTSSLPVRFDKTAKEFGELKLISGDPAIKILELLKFGVWHS